MNKLLPIILPFINVYDKYVEDTMYYLNPDKKKVNPNYRNAVPNPKQKELRTFIVRGVQIQAYNKKDAIKRYNHQSIQPKK